MNGDASREYGHCNPKQKPHCLILHCFQYPIIITKASIMKSVKGKLKKSDGQTIIIDNNNTEYYL